MRGKYRAIIVVLVAVAMASSVWFVMTSVAGTKCFAPKCRLIAKKIAFVRTRYDWHIDGYCACPLRGGTCTARRIELRGVLNDACAVYKHDCVDNECRYPKYACGNSSTSKAVKK